MSALLSMAHWAHALRVEDAPLGVQERLRWQAASVFGAAAAGLTAKEVQPGLALAHSLGAGRHAVAPGVGGLSLEGALFAGATLSMAQEYDDYLLCGHTGHSAVWAAWLGAAELGLGWPEALRAQLAANELMGRLGGFCLAGRQTGQTCSFLHTFGGALVAGLLRGLSPERLAHALALALAQAPHLDARLFTGPGKVLTAARPLVDGWRLATLAAVGMDGPLDLLERDGDFLAVFAGGKPLRGWLSGLPAGREGPTGWLTWSLAIKAAPGCAYLATSLEALNAIADELFAEGQLLRAEDVLRVDVDAGLLTLAMERSLGGPEVPLHPVSVTFSVARSLALRLVAGAVSPETLRSESLAAQSEAVLHLASRVHVRHDWRHTLTTWNSLRQSMGIDRLLSGIGPGPLLAAAGRAGGLGVEAGLSLAELPMAFASDRWQDFDKEEASALLGRGIGRLTSLAARGVERVLSSAPGKRERRAPFDLASQALETVSFPLPARVRVLLHGGQVREAEVALARGAPGRPTRETAALVHDKLLMGLASAGSLEAALPIANALLGPSGRMEAGTPVPLPGAGPREWLAQLAGPR